LRNESQHRVNVAEHPSHSAQTLDIVVVDDNLDSAESLAVLLTLLGHRVRTASDGPSAMAACQLKCPDLIFLDIGLPGMDGYEVARRLRDEFGHEQALKLVALTGYGQVDDVRKSLDAGFDHHFVKPIEPSALTSLFETPAGRTNAQ